MVPSTESAFPSKAFLTRFLREYLSGRRGLLVLGMAVLGAGAALSWGWLTAIGIAPILIALAPCAAMCALGLYMNRTSANSCSTGTRARAPAAAMPSDVDGGAVAPSVNPEPRTFNERSTTNA